MGLSERVVVSFSENSYLQSTHECACVCLLACLSVYVYIRMRAFFSSSFSLHERVCVWGDWGGGMH